MTQLQNTAFKMKMAPVPFVGDILPKAGAMVVSEHDGHIYYADKYGWHKADAEYSPVTIFVDFDGTNQFKFQFKAPLTSTLEIKQGDGTVDEVAGNNTTRVTYTTTYAAAGKYTFVVGGDVFTLTEFRLSAVTFIAYDATNLGRILTLDTINLNSSINVYGDVGEWSELSVLTSVIGTGTKLSGDASKLRSLTALTNLNLNTPYFTFESSDPWDLTNATAVNVGNEHSPETVDRIIKALKGITGSLINLMLSNPRTIASDPDLLTLLENNTYIILQEAHEIDGLGPELHVGPNAASDPNGNEADATTGWTPTNLDAPNIFRSQRLKKKSGAFAIEASSNPNPTDGAAIAQSFDCLLGDIMRLAFEWHHVGGVAPWAVNIDGGARANSFLNPVDNTFRKNAIYTISEGTSVTFSVGELAYLDGGIILDDFSARVLTP